MKKKDKLRIISMITLGLCLIITHIMQYYLIGYFVSVLFGFILFAIIDANLKELENWSDIRLEAIGKTGREAYENIRKNKKKDHRKNSR